MSVPSQLLSARIRWQVLAAEPDTLDVICAHVASGGSGLDLAELWQVRWSDMVKWLCADPERNQVYAQAAQARGEWFVEEILRELRRVAVADPTAVFGPDGAMLPPQQWSVAARAAVAAVETDELWEGRGEGRTQVGVTRRVKFWDKLRALELLGKNRSMFTERHEHRLVKSFEDLILESMKGTTNGKQQSVARGEVGDQGEKSEAETSAPAIGREAPANPAEGVV